MVDVIHMEWVNPPALAIGSSVMGASVFCHIYSFKKGHITHSHNEQYWCAALAASVFFMVWLVTTFYVLAVDGVFMIIMNAIWYSVTSWMITWQLGRALAAIYTIRAWQRANPHQFPDSTQKSA
jgi:hypothetical protein